MDYITPEQFLKQPKEVQQVFIDWWKPSSLDLVCWTRTKYSTALRSDKSGLHDADIKKNFIPLLTEGQLRKFIEDKTGGTIDLYYTHMEDKTYKTIDRNKYLELSCLREIIFRMRLKSDADIFKAYWQCALKIARGEFRK